MRRLPAQIAAVRRALAGQLRRVHTREARAWVVSCPALDRRQLTVRGVGATRAAAQRDLYVALQLALRALRDGFDVRAVASPGSIRRARQRRRLK